MKLKDHLNAAPFTLALSSGYFGFFAHCGLAKALEEVGVKPTRFTGSSAGAILAASLAHGVPVNTIEMMVQGLTKRDFWDPGVGFGLLKGAKLEAMIRRTLTGQRLRAALAISTFDILSRQTRSFAFDAATVSDEKTITHVARLVRASTAVPLMFHPVRIGHRFFWDGGILDKMGTHGTSPQERVLVAYLPGRDPHSLYERRRDLATMGGSRSALVLTDLPAVGPNSLDVGLAALDRAYEKTLQALDTEWSPTIEV